MLRLSTAKSRGLLTIHPGFSGISLISTIFISCYFQPDSKNRDDVSVKVLEAWTICPDFENILVQGWRIINTISKQDFFFPLPCLLYQLCKVKEKKKEHSRKTSTSALLTMPKPLTVWITTNWKIQEMGIPDHLTCLLRNLYAGQEATVRTGQGMTDCIQIGNGIHQGCILSPSLFNLYAEYIIWNAGLDEAQAGIKIAGRNISNFRYANDTTL